MFDKKPFIIGQGFPKNFPFKSLFAGKEYMKWTHLNIIRDSAYKNNKEWDVKIVITNSSFINPFIIVIQIYRNNFVDTC